MDLGTRLEELGRVLGEREATHAAALDRARKQADVLHDELDSALSRFHSAAARAGSPHLEILLGEPQIDDKHIRAVEFDLRRGRYRAIVTVKSRGVVTLVGPFRTGKTERPCRSFPADSESEIELALGDFLERFLEVATTP